MVLRRVGILSVGKISGATSALFGLIAGAFISLFALVGFAAQQIAPHGQGPAALPTAVLGGAAIVLLPIFYGIFGFIGGVIYAALYNFIAGIVGGIEMQFESFTPPASY